MLVMPRRVPLLLQLPSGLTGHAAAAAAKPHAVMMVCGFVLAWQRFYDEDKAIEEEMKENL